MQHTLFKIILAVLLVTGSLASIAQSGNPDTSIMNYYSENYLRYQDYIYVNNIKTPLLYKPGWEMGNPVLNLHTADQLKLSFDDLEGGIKNYRYTVVHCNSDWQPSGLLTQEYLQGYVENYIDDYRFSFNTLQAYTHYEVSFPNDNMSLLRSGNYVLVVYPENHPDQPVLTRRFWVLDQKVSVEGLVRRPGNLEDRDEKQQVLFSIFSSQLNLVDPYQNLTVIIRQNGRWDNQITNLKPLLIKGEELDYHHVDGNIFYAGNEYRHADLKSTRYTSDRVRKIDGGEGLYRVYLMNDERRPFKVYVTEEDINGKFLVKTEDARDAETEADYVEVIFTLPYFPVAADGNFFVSGALAQWQLTKENRMTYQFSEKAYQLRLLLKQGYYNYQYLFVENGTSEANAARVEGNHYETGNEYTIYVYYHSPGDNYQQLIAIKTLNSGDGK